MQRILHSRTFRTQTKVHEKSVPTWENETLNKVSLVFHGCGRSATNQHMERQKHIAGSANLALGTKPRSQFLSRPLARA